MPRERVIPPSAFAVQGVSAAAAAFPYPLSGNEQLRISLRSNQGSALLATTIRYWDEAAQAVQVQTEQITSAVNGSTATYPLPRGALLNVRLSTAQSVVGPDYCEFFARAQIVKGAPPGATIVITTILQGYLSPQVEIAWPGSPIQSMHEGLGFVRDVIWTVGAAPLRAEAAIPDGVKWQIVCGQLFVVTDATAATRQIVLQILNALSTRVWEGVGVADQLASETKSYNFGPGIQPNAVDTANKRFIAFPADVFFRRADTLKISVSNAQAGDTITPGVLRVREWLDE